MFLYFSNPSALAYTITLFYGDPCSPWVYEWLLENKKKLKKKLSFFEMTSGTFSIRFLGDRLSPPCLPSDEAKGLGRGHLSEMQGQCLLHSRKGYEGAESYTYCCWKLLIFLKSHELTSCSRLSVRGNRDIAFPCQLPKTLFTWQCFNHLFIVTLCICYQALVYKWRYIFKNCYRDVAFKLRDICRLYRRLSFMHTSLRANEI